MTRAAATERIHQMLPTLASCSLKDMTDARTLSQVQFFQLYVNADRSVTKRLVEEAERRGCKGLFITVDAPTLAKREKDMRVKFVDEPPDVQQDVQRDQGATKAISKFIDPALCWDDIPWFRSITKMPIVIKGI